MRAARADTIEKLAEITVRLVRSCNDQWALYGSVTQRDISDALVEMGYGVDMRAVRLSQPIRRLCENLVLIQFERDLKQEITVRIVPDRELEDEREEEAEPTEVPAEAAPESAETASEAPAAD